MSCPTSELRVRLVTSNIFKPPVIFLLTVPGVVSCVDLFLLFAFVFVILSCLFLAALWSPVGKGLTS